MSTYCVFFWRLTHIETTISDASPLMKRKPFRSNLIMAISPFPWISRICFQTFFPMSCGFSPGFPTFFPTFSHVFPRLHQFHQHLAQRRAARHAERRQQGLELGEAQRRQGPGARARAKLGLDFFRWTFFRFCSDFGRDATIMLIMHL